MRHVKLYVTVTAAAYADTDVMLHRREISSPQEAATWLVKAVRDMPARPLWREQEIAELERLRSEAASELEQTFAAGTPCEFVRVTLAERARDMLAETPKVVRGPVPLSKIREVRYYSLSQKRVITITRENLVGIDEKGRITYRDEKGGLVRWDGDPNLASFDIDEDEPGTQN